MANDLKNESRRAILQKLGIGAASLVVAGKLLEGAADAKAKVAPPDEKNFDQDLKDLGKSGELIAIEMRLPTSAQGQNAQEFIELPIVSESARLPRGTKIVNYPLNKDGTTPDPLPSNTDTTYYVGGSPRNGFLSVALSVNNGQMEVFGIDHFWTAVKLQSAKGENEGRCNTHISIPLL